MLTYLDRPRTEAPGALRRPQAVVIGSGFGGLAAAIRLGARGYRVTVLEKLDAPGGRAYVYRQDGFTFDSGPTIITAPWLLEELWALCGRDLHQDIELKSLSPFYDIRFHDGSVFTYSGDAEAMRAEVAKFSPDDVPRFERFMQQSKKIYDYGFGVLADVPFSSFATMLRAVPKIALLGGHRTVYGLVSSYIRDPRLRIAISLHPLLIGGNPFSVTAMYCLINHMEREWGVHFAMGGTGEVVKGLAGLIRGQGNSLRFNAEVGRILTTEGRATGVELTSGERIDSDIVVSNADAPWTYTKLLPQKRRRWTPAKVRRTQYSMGLFVWYFGTNRQFPAIKHHTMVLGPRYEGLLRDIFKNKTLAEDFSIYLHRPTATDPALAPPGCDTFYALSPVPHLEADCDWQAQAEAYRRRVEQRLEETIMPGLGASIVSSRMMTPQDFATRYNSYLGAGFGPEPLLWQSAWFRPHNASEEIEGLYMVGASTHPGAGIPGVIASARVLDKVVPHASALV